MAGFQLSHSFGGGAKGLSVWLLLSFFMMVEVHSLEKSNHIFERIACRTHKMKLIVPS